MKNIYKVSLTIISILLLMSLFVACDYSKYKKNNSKEEINEAIVLNEGNLSINYNSGDSFNIKNLSDGYQMEKTFSITNMGDSTVYYKISLNDIENNIKNGKVTISLNSTNDGAVLSNVDFPEEASEITDLIRIPPEKTQTYKLTLKYSGDSDQSSYLKGMISVKLRDNDIQTFADIILVNNEIKESVTTPGKAIANTSEGLIESTDEEGKTYYFRGNISNNYVSFAGLTWRIVRINGDDTVRLVLDGLINDGNTYSYTDKEISEGRNDYYTLAEFEGSNVESKLKEWYTNTLSEYGVKVAEGKFCSDTNLSKEETDISYFSSTVRIKENESPLFNCIGNIYNAQIGMLSVDEAVYAGAFKSDENRNYYLYNENFNSDWWLSNPYSILSDHSVTMFSVISSNGTLSTGTKVSDLRAIRPVINIRNNVTVTGTGTAEDPYIIQ